MSGETGRCDMGDRRTFLRTSSQAAASALAAAALAASSSEAQAPAPTSSKKLKILMRSGWGTDDPTRGSFVFAHALVFADAGHEVQIFLTGEATYLMRKTTVEAVKPIGWPALSEMMQKIVAKGVPVFS
jgi:TRAP-type mannitol/chloroaromatic compound transport system substrate-binding protein